MIVSGFFTGLFNYYNEKMKRIYRGRGLLKGDFFFPCSFL